METEIKDEQFCPICGVEVEVILRYPNYVCRRCAGKASSTNRRLLSFYNEDFGGGFFAFYRGTGKEFDFTSRHNNKNGTTARTEKKTGKNLSQNKFSPPIATQILSRK